MSKHDARSDDLPSGLVFFRPDAPLAARRRRLTVVAILIAAAVALTWPVYSLFSAARPLVFGFPMPLAWAILWALVIFANLAWLFRCGDERPLDEAPDGNREDG